MKDLGHAELAVWLVLFRDVRNGTAKTGMTDIAKRAGMTRRAVVKAMSKLRKKRLVEVVKRGHVGGSPNVYIVHGIKKT
jgi:DNA-binding IscR family transcriptional regulator